MLHFLDSEAQAGLPPLFGHFDTGQMQATPTLIQRSFQLALKLAGLNVKHEMYEYRRCTVFFEVHSVGIQTYDFSLEWFILDISIIL